MQQEGILTKITGKYEKPGSWKFNTYSYRGIFDSFCILNSANIDLVGWYAVSMVNQANALNQTGLADEAIRLYKRALNFPNEKPEANICYNVALAYEKKHDYNNEFLYLKRALDKDGKILAAIERAGILCYEKGLYVQSKEYFDRAVSLGSGSEIVQKGLNILNSMNETQRLEAMLIKANEYIEKQDLIKATEIYDFLIEKQYKSAIIYRNIGVYHSRTGDFNKAIESFNRSKNETPTSDAYLYTAYAYFKQNMPGKAIIELEAGLKQFPGDKGLTDLYGQMKVQEKSSEKNSHSNYRQR
jgi:tetratricopeptide (TPR) repeat protein